MSLEIVQLICDTIPIIMITVTIIIIIIIIIITITIIITKRMRRITRTTITGRGKLTKGGKTFSCCKC